MSSRRVVLFAVCLFVAIEAPAATVGSLSATGNTGLSGSGAFMSIDIAHPAAEAGTLTTASVRWSALSLCTNAFKLKFLRPQFNGTFTVIAERGPFNAVQGFVTIALTPPVTVAAGDLLGVVQLQPATCGTMQWSRGGNDAVFMIANLDPAVGANITGIPDHGLIPNARASSDPNVVDGYIPVIGSTAGGFGAQFKTSVQLSNTDLPTLNGRLVFHPAGAPASASDPSISYSLGQGKSTSFDNIMDSFGRTGLGSVDVVTTSSGAPLITTRVFNDAGSVVGTSGFTEETVLPQQVLRLYDIANFTIPSDLTNFRVNIGVRSLDAGATLSVAMYNGAGSFAGGPFTKTYPANYFEQVSLSQFVNGTTLPAGGVVQIQVQSGNAILYGTTNDNRSNDPNFKYFAR